MSHERIKYIKDNLMRCIEGQMCNLYEADPEELGEAIDMLKDLEEALYYCTITEAMEGKGSHGGNEYEFEFNKHQEHSHYPEGGGSREYYQEYPMMYNMPRMYESGQMYNNGRSSGGMGGNNSNGSGGSSRSNFSEPMAMRDYREGRSPESRRMYMESKEMNHDKATQLRELEKYMQELSSDVVDMIQDSTSDEKQYLEKKLMALASKISQMK